MRGPEGGTRGAGRAPGADGHAVERVPEGAGARIRRAREPYGKRQDGEALALIDRAISGDAGNAALHNERGSFLVPMGRNGEALEAIGHAIRLAPKGPAFHGNRSVALKAPGRDRESLDARNLAAQPDGTGEAPGQA